MVDVDRYFRSETMHSKLMGSAIVASILMSAGAASAQLIPEPWVMVGTKDSAITYGAGVKFMDFGATVGVAPNGVAGFDVLKFISFPFVSPYVGLGTYGNSGVSYSTGLQFFPPGNTFFGAEYHSVRGVSGQVGIKF
jgi:hypothetical protein